MFGIKIKSIMKLVLLFIFFLGFKASAQNFIYHGDKSYISTKTWQFTDNTRRSSLGPQITIGKDKSNGVVLFSIEAFSDQTVNGALMIFLENGTIIKCLDRNRKDKLDHRALNIYYLTSEEVEQLKKFRIIKIRYNVSNSLEKNSFTAINQIRKLEKIGSKEPNYNLTEIDVKELFKN